MDSGKKRAGIVAQKQIWRLQPVTLALIAFFLVNSIIINLALEAAHQQNALSYLKKYLAQTALDDSWMPIREAMQFTETYPTKLLYSEIWFNRNIKFQYPPTSMLLIEPLRHSIWGDLASDIRLNRISWFMILIIALLNGVIFSTGMRKNSDLADASLLDKSAWLLLPAGFTLTFYPLLRSYSLGQIQTWIDFLFAALIFAWLNNRRGISGVMGGLICAIKPPLGLLLVWGLLRKQWRFVIGFSITILLAVLVSLAAYGLKNHLDYLKLLSFISQHGESFYPNQSVNGLLNRLFFNGSNLLWEQDQFAPYNPWVAGGTWLTSAILILGALFWQRKTDRPAGGVDLSLATLSFTIASPIAWEHHYGILLTIFAVVAPIAIYHRRGHPTWLILIAAAYLITSNVYLIMNQFALTPFNFLQSYLFFGAIILLAVLYHMTHLLRQED
jgi:alpha-1,2-mannosyltransferase